jgi:uncharacterized protein YdaU (DUF1376 family)
MSGAAWYKHNPRDFLEGVQGMGPEAIGAYIVVLDLIYARGGSVPADWRYLAGVMGCSARLAKSLVERLIEAGKLTEVDGLLTNQRAQNELESQAKLLRKLSEAGANGGRKRAEKQAAANENSDLQERGLKAGSSIRDRDRDKSSVDKSTDAEASPDKAFWDAAKKYLGGQKSGGLIGKWCRDYGQAETAKAITQSQIERAVDPVPFIAACLKRNAVNLNRPSEGAGMNDDERSRIMGAV